MTTPRPATAPLAPIATFAPSWVDRLQAWLDAAPARLVGFYAGLPVALFLLTAAMHWWDGSLAPGRFAWFHAVPPLSLALAMAFMHYLDRSAERSLRAFRPALHLGDDQVEALRYRLTHLPARGAARAAAWGVGVSVIGLTAIRSLDLGNLVLLTSPQASAVEIGIYVLMWIALATFLYHSKHQLFTVRHIFAHCTRVHVLRLEPIYSFSWLTGRTAIGLVAIGYLWFFSAQDLYASGPYLIAYPIAFTMLALVVFAWPLWGMHRVLVREKRTRSDELGAKLERAIERLYAAADAEDLSQVDGLNKLIATLTLARAELERVSTWPWRSETSRLVVSTLLLPLVVYLAQRALSYRLGV